jgi:hypothetical protein
MMAFCQIVNEFLSQVKNLVVYLLLFLKLRLSEEEKKFINIRTKFMNKKNKL